MADDASYVVTGGAQGVGRAIAERLAHTGQVVVLDTATSLGWSHPRVILHSGDAGDGQIAAAAAARAEAAAPLAGWVNNAALFRDAALTTATTVEITGLITANLALVVTGCHAAVNHFRAHRRPGAIVNVSSHQAQRPVRGALPWPPPRPPSRA